VAISNANSLSDPYQEGKSLYPDALSIPPWRSQWGGITGIAGQLHYLVRFSTSMCKKQLKFLWDISGELSAAAVIVSCTSPSFIPLPFDLTTISSLE